MGVLVYMADMVRRRLCGGEFVRWILLGMVIMQVVVMVVMVMVVVMVVMVVVVVVMVVVVMLVKGGGKGYMCVYSSVCVGGGMAQCDTHLPIHLKVEGWEGNYDASDKVYEDLW